MNNNIEYLELSDIKDNLITIKINKLYKPGMSAVALYEATRGYWRRKIESVRDADYALSVANGMVLEVYKIDGWYKAGTIPMETRNKPLHPERIEFKGEVAPEKIRNRYINKCVKHLYKNGEASPVKNFYPCNKK